jgi:hypothetical protein
VWIRCTARWALQLQDATPLLALATRLLEQRLSSCLSYLVTSCHILTQPFDRAAQVHGMCLTSAALAYCTIARHGISETEMQELLSLEDDALADSYDPPPLLPCGLDKHDKI